jgi:hypothetical protein
LFKPGDKVVCVSGHVSFSGGNKTGELVKGEVYTIDEVVGINSVKIVEPYWHTNKMKTQWSLSYFEYLKPTKPIEEWL